ncbi:MAG: NAD(P)-dependent alcohol dehydrogenase [Proteobacteria bacterium]|nr:NAD(P)-dependent alcohol dehydrogenase [Pseudomonadota bacterium]
MSKSKAYAAMTAKAPLVPFTFERREPKDFDVSIDIKFCGICHSDIHSARGEWGDAIFPMVPGHEIAGIVKSIGKKITKFKVGDHVGVGCFVDSCRTCNPCKSAEEQYCEQFPTFTYNSLERETKAPTFGGYSDHIVVNQDYVLRIPSHLPLDAAAPLLCAGITLYSPLRHWKVEKGTKVAIIGLGGLGHMGVKLAAAMGAEVTVLSQSNKKEQDAKRLGAHHFFATNDKSVFAKLANTFDLIINTVSVDINWGDYLGLLRLDGNMVIVGVPEKPVMMTAGPLIFRRRNLAGSLIGGIKETQEMLDFCGKNNIVCDIEKIPMEKVNEAYERVVKSDVRYRFVLDISTL